MHIMRNRMATELTELLEERGWSQRELSRRAGVAHTSIAKVISGEINPTMIFCQRISKAVDVPVEELYRWAGILPEVTKYPSQFDDWARRLAGLSSEARKHALAAMELVLQLAEVPR